MKAYKLLRIKKDGKLYPLFIGKTKATEIGVWLQAECIPTKGFAVRKGFHVVAEKPQASHLKEELSNGEKRIWCEVEIEDYQPKKVPKNQGGKWYIAQKMKLIKPLTEEEKELILKGV